MMHYRKPNFRLMGDRALLVELGDEISPQVNRSIRALFMRLKDRGFEGIKELVPSYRSLTVVYDPLALSVPRLKSQITELIKTLDDFHPPDPRTVEIPVAYGGQYGPDLQWVADYHNITPEDVVRLHIEPIYQVYMIGFMPGYPYMGEVVAALVTPRRKTPRTHVARGSVGIAHRQTGIYSVASSGGWQIIGRTPVHLFDPHNQPPSLLEMGDRVKFVAIDAEEMDSWRQP
jgi:KipI family sensor histidine kinase inhibitor